MFDVALRGSSDTSDAIHDRIQETPQCYVQVNVFPQKVCINTLEIIEQTRSQPGMHSATNQNTRACDSSAENDVRQCTPTNWNTHLQKHAQYVCEHQQNQVKRYDHKTAKQTCYPSTKYKEARAGSARVQHQL